MAKLTWPKVTITQAVRWLARGLSLVIAGTIVLFAVGEDGLHRAKLSTPEAVQLVFFFTAWLGLLVAWRWERLGAVMILGGMLLFYFANYLAVGRWPGGWAFAVIASPGALFLWCGLSAQHGQARRLANSAPPS